MKIRTTESFFFRYSLLHPGNVETGRIIGMCVFLALSDICNDFTLDHHSCDFDFAF